MANPIGSGRQPQDQAYRVLTREDRQGQAPSQDGIYGNTLSQHGGYAPAAPHGAHRGKGPRNFTRADARLEEQVCELLMEHDEIDPTNVEVHVTNGEVALTGSVEDRRQRRLIEDLVGSVSGVRDLHMSIEIQDPHHA